MAKAQSPRKPRLEKNNQTAPASKKQNPTTKPTTVQQKRAPAHEWLASFVKTPKPDPSWGIIRSDAFLRLYSVATQKLGCTKPKLQAAAVIRHRLGLLDCQDTQLIAALAYMPRHDLSRLTTQFRTAYATHRLTDQQFALLDPSPDELRKQCTPPRPRPRTKFSKPTPAVAAPETQHQYGQ